MVHQPIKVYARIKKECKDTSLILYEITQKKKEYEDLTLYPASSYHLSACSFRFHKIFNLDTHQSDIFGTVAVPVINSVIEGFNGTIFAYGQTGSGKTYTVTGSSKNYDQRGVTPRAIQYIFKHYENIPEKPTIYISYMEIYNEIGYDLLSTKQTRFSKILDELPRISLLEDKKGDAHIRNLTVVPVTTEEEAMRLLFLGDTNRTIAETASNEFSSRSHCIFTLYINLRDSNSPNLRSSKLHLVDLAGSERISKTHSKGQCLQEAKSINLSLHYLQHVILALSEANRSHVPYRNSMLTHILKDSLNGNCITSMLATLSIVKGNIEESISTCRFAQKVSMITTDPVINVLDPQREIAFLKLKIQDLEKRLSSVTHFTNRESLSKQNMDGYLGEVETFIGSDKKLLVVEPDMTAIQFCFNVLKNEVTKKRSELIDVDKLLVKRSEEVAILKDELCKKDKEIHQLKNIIDRIPENPIALNCFNTQPHIMTVTQIPSKLHTEEFKNFNSGENRLYEKFMSTPEITDNLTYYKTALENKFSLAKTNADIIEVCQKKINIIRQKLDTPLNRTERDFLIPELEKQQAIYKKTLVELKSIQSETDHLQCGLNQAKVKSQHKFEIWAREKDFQMDSEEYERFKEKYYNKLYGDLMKSEVNHVFSDNEYHKCIDRLKFENQLKYFDCPDASHFPNSGECNFSNGLHCCKSNNVLNRSSSFTPVRGIGNELYANQSSCIKSQSEKQFSLQPFRCITDCNHCFNSDTAIPQPSHLNNYHNDPVTRQDYENKMCIANPQPSQPDKNSIPHKYVNEPEDLIATKDSSFPIVSLLADQYTISAKSSNENATNIAINLYTNEENNPKDDMSELEIIVEGVENNFDKYFITTDSSEFKEFMRSVNLSGLAEVDAEIFNFYRSKFH